MQLSQRGSVMVMIGVAALLGVSRASWTDDAKALTDEDRSDLAWFDSLGYPPSTGKRFVRAARSAEEHVAGWEIRGFLADDSPTKAKILCLGLDEHVIERSPAGTPDAVRTKIEPLDAVDLAETWLHGGASPTAPLDGWPRPEEPSISTQILVLASALNAEGGGRKRALVHDLLAHARTLRHEHWRHYPDADDPSKPLRERAAADLAEVETIRATFALFGFSEERKPLPRRREELGRFNAIVRRFPGTRAVLEAGEKAAVLERMVREAEDHAKRAPTPAAATVDDRVRELIFGLREQYADGPSAMGAPGMILSGPYKELVGIDRPAVPQLIEALADESLTRVGGEGRGIARPYVLTVGDLAMQALEEIAGQSFPIPPETKLPQGDRRAYRAALRAAMRPAIDAWLAAANSGREADSLAKRVEDGDWKAAERLLTVDPDRYSIATLRGFLAAKHPMTRGQMLDLLAKRPAEAGLAALQTEAKSGDAWTRLPAAKVLADFRDPAAADALLALWHERRDGGGPPTWVPDHSTGRDRDDELRTIAGALLAMRRADLVGALADSLPRRAPLVRRVLAQELAKVRSAVDGEMARAVEDALASVLEDVEEIPDEHGPSIRAPGLALRVKDVSASALAAARGLTPPQLSDPLHVRDVAVARVANAWRREHDAPEVAVAELPPLAAVDPTEVRKVITAFAATDYGSAAFEARLKDIETLPLAALPELRSSIADVRRPWSDALSASIGRFAFRVRAVRFAPEGWGVPESLRSAAVPLLGQTLTPSSISDLGLRMVREVGGELRGASLDVWRGTGNDGAVITITLLDGSSGGWTFGALGVRGDRFVEEGWGQGGWSRDPPRDHGTLLRMVEAALAAPPGERSWIHVSAVRHPYVE